MKTCRKCGETKPITDFYAMAGMRDGHRNECKACNLREKAERHRLDPQPARDRVKAWQAANPERVRERQQQYKASGRKAQSDRRSYLKRKYGVTPEWYDEQLATQRGGCAICGRPPRTDIALHVDHDHETGALRSLLCFTCNNLLGDVKDDAVLLSKAIDYLDRHDPVAEEERALVRRRAFALVSGR
jgi:hypothetical protein